MRLCAGYVDFVFQISLTDEDVFQKEVNPKP